MTASDNPMGRLTASDDRRRLTDEGASDGPAVCAAVSVRWPWAPEAGKQSKRSSTKSLRYPAERYSKGQYVYHTSLAQYDTSGGTSPLRGTVTAPPPLPLREHWDMFPAPALL